MNSRDTTSGPTEGDVRAASPSTEQGGYTGRLGQTRLEWMQVQRADGGFMPVELCVGINALTHPDLAERALRGDLHVVDNISLAVPFIYHDPRVSKFALVVPWALRHRELVERAELLIALSKDGASDIPPYVRNFVVVCGQEGLSAYVRLDVRTNAGTSLDHMILRERELKTFADELDRRVRELGEREARLASRLDELAIFEAELRATSDRLESTQRRLLLREHALEVRLEVFRQRESASPESKEGLASPHGYSGAPEPHERTLERRAGAMRAEHIGQAFEQLGDAWAERRLGVEVGDAEEETATEEVTSVVASQPASQPGQPIERRATKRHDRLTLIGPFSKSFGTSKEHAQLEAEGTKARRASNGMNGSRQRTRSTVEFRDDGVQLKLELPQTEKGESRVERAELLIQLVLEGEDPVVLLTVSGSASGKPFARRCAVDPREPRARAGLEKLGRSFVANASFYSRDGQLVQAVQLRAPREGNVAAILNTVEAMVPKDRLAAPESLERALSHPPPMYTEEKITLFDADLPEVHSAKDTLVRIAELDAAVSDGAIERAVLVLSMPYDVVEERLQSLLSGAFRHGISLSESLRERALALGLVADEEALVHQLVQAFRETVVSLDRGGLTSEEIASNWETLLGLADRHELAIDAETHELAWDCIRRVRIDSGIEGMGDSEAFARRSTEELMALLERPTARVQAAIALCERGDPAHASAVYQAMRSMARKDVVRVVPRLTRLGDTTVEMFIEGLTAKKTFVRQASALALGYLKNRRAVAPLVEMLRAEPSQAWQEVARVIASFGAAALPAVVRAAREPKGAEERFVFALANFANHGCERDLAAFTQDTNSNVAQLAREALAVREVVRLDEAVIRGERQDPAGNAVLAFSRRFYEELAGTAPEGDLADTADLSDAPELR